MRGSLCIAAAFLSGLLLARADCLPALVAAHDFSAYALYLLMLLVGVGVGHGKHLGRALRRHSPAIALIPLGTIVGTLCFSALAAQLLTGVSLAEGLAIGSGMGYYSLSSILIAKAKGAELGTMALTANVARELATLLAAPLLVRYFGKLAPIAAGGATTMDTTLPAISKYSGSEYVVIAIFHGMVTDWCVPLLVSFFLSF